MPKKESYKKDDLFDKAVEIALKEGMISIAILQKELSIGYRKAHRLLSELTQEGVAMLNVNWEIIRGLWDEYQWSLMLAFKEGYLSVPLMRRKLSMGYKRARRVFKELQNSFYINSKGELEKKYIPKVMELLVQLDKVNKKLPASKKKGKYKQKYKFIDLIKLDVDRHYISKFGLTDYPEKDDELIELLIKADNGEIPVYLDMLPIEKIIPFSKFQPKEETLKATEKIFLENIRQGEMPYLNVYPEENFYVMSVDYHAYFFYLNQKYENVPCVIFGNYMQTLYRGVVTKRILYPESIIITSENLEQIDFDKVIYCEISEQGAMGHEGGIIIYVLENEDTLVTYETNAFIYKHVYDITSEKISQKIDFFTCYDGGFGNYVYVKKDVSLEIDIEYNCFWYHSKNTKLRIDSSVKGVFDAVISKMIA